MSLQDEAHAIGDVGVFAAAQRPLERLAVDPSDVGIYDGRHPCADHRSAQPCGT